MGSGIVWGLVAVNLILLFGLVGCALSLRSAKSRLEQLAEEKARLAGRLTALEAELGAMMDGTFGMSEKLETLRHDLKHAIQNQQRLEQRDLGAQPYEQAVRMAEQGETDEDLMKRCGLSRAEAELVRLLHPSMKEKAVS